MTWRLVVTLYARMQIRRSEKILCVLLQIQGPVRTPCCAAGVVVVEDPVDPANITVPHEHRPELVEGACVCSKSLPRPEPVEGALSAPCRCVTVMVKVP